MNVSEATVYCINRWGADVQVASSKHDFEQSARVCNYIPLKCKSVLVHMSIRDAQKQVGRCKCRRMSSMEPIHTKTYSKACSFVGAKLQCYFNMVRNAAAMQLLGTWLPLSCHGIDSCNGSEAVLEWGCKKMKKRKKNENRGLKAMGKFWIGLDVRMLWSRIFFDSV